MGTDAEMRLDFRPRYLQIADKMLDMIRSKIYKYGERLPSEPELARMFGVSRSTVREAVRALAQDGVVIVRHGLGTFVAGEQAFVKSDLTELGSITRAIEQRNWTAGTIHARMYEETADEELAERLQMDEPRDIIGIERVRTADSQPIFYSVLKVVKQRGGNMILSWNMDGSFLDFLACECGVSILYAVTSVLPVNNPREIADRMGIGDNVPILLLDQIHYDIENRPIFRSYDYYRADVFKFHIIRRIRQPQ